MSDNKIPVTVELVQEVLDELTHPNRQEKPNVH